MARIHVTQQRMEVEHESCKCSVFHIKKHLKKNKAQRLKIDYFYGLKKVLETFLFFLGNVHSLHSLIYMVHFIYFYYK